MDNAFAQSTDEVLSSLGVDAASGLTDGQVVDLRLKHGKNAIAEEPPTPIWELILEQFKDQLVIILLGSAAVSFVLALFEEEGGLGAFVDPAVILTILILNAVVGVSQESSAEKAIAALQEYSANEANVIRNGGQVSRIKAEELVPGDIVSVTVGDRIPADCRLLHIQSNSFAVDQAILTGESESVGKDSNAVVRDSKAVKQDQVNMLFSGTTVVTGRAQAVVVLTGSKTAIGDIHESITAQISEPTPLKQKLNDFGDSLAKVITVICILVWLINIPHFNDPSHGSFTKGAIYYLKIAVSLGVAAIPEGLAVVITTCLALGTRKMAAKNAVVRSLPSVETLGSCSVICSDKTGTLTTNQMSVSNLVYIKEDGSSLEELAVEGTTFEPRGSITMGGKVVEDLASKSATILQMTEVAALCNDARLAYDSRQGVFTSIGEPTEGALRVLTEKVGPCAPRNAHPEECVHYASSWYEKKYARLATFEFSRDRKSMSVLVRNGKQSKLLVKGAPESIIERCTHALIGADAKKVKLDKRLSDVLLKEVVDYGNQGLRVIALASIDDVSDNPLVKKAKSTAEYAQLEQNMTFLGMVGMLDPPRPEVPESIRKCKDAGIRVIVVTGDNRNTAESICRKIGVFGEFEDLKGKSYTGREFDNLSPKQQLEAAKTASLFSRVEPSHKSKLVDLLQQLGEVVAMTGDGVNDAPALKEADIGVAMGMAGTEVAKGAADMVLTDDNFCSIVAAVEKGRTIYTNIQKFVCFLLSTNFGEISIIFVAIAVGMPNPLEPLQILVLNIFADGMAAVALSLEKADPLAMKDRPRPKTQPIIHGRLWMLVITNAFLIGAGALVVFAMGLYWNFKNVLLVDILNGAKTVHDYKQVRCFRWQGVHERWKLYANCEATYRDGSPVFPFWKPGMLEFEDDYVYCRAGEYECLTTGVARAQTMAFIYITTMEMLRAYTARSFTNHVFVGFFANKYMQLAAVGSITLTLFVTHVPFVMDELFGFAKIYWFQWLFAIVLAFVGATLGEMLKCVYRYNDRHRARWSSIGDGFNAVIFEIRNLRHHVEHLEDKLQITSHAPARRLSLVTSTTAAHERNGLLSRGQSATSVRAETAARVANL